jgi:hypothetical protein
MLIQFTGTSKYMPPEDGPILRLTHGHATTHPPRSRCLSLQWDCYRPSVFSVYFDGELLDNISKLYRMRITDAMAWVGQHHNQILIDYGFPFFVEWKWVEHFPVLYLRKDITRWPSSANAITR